MGFSRYGHVRGPVPHLRTTTTRGKGRKGTARGRSARSEASDSEARVLWYPAAAARGRQATHPRPPGAAGPAGPGLDSCGGAASGSAGLVRAPAAPGVHAPLPGQRPRTLLVVWPTGRRRRSRSGTIRPRIRSGMVRPPLGTVIWIPLTAIARARCTHRHRIGVNTGDTTHRSSYR